MVIVSHGAPDLLRRCLQSLEGPLEQRPRGVTVVDSGSPDSIAQRAVKPAICARRLRLEADLVGGLRLVRYSRTSAQVS